MQIVLFGKLVQRKKFRKGFYDNLELKLRIKFYSRSFYFVNGVHDVLHSSSL